jgi:sec-independent protein translocase protein TatA
MGWDAPWHWVIVAILVIALFGYKKMPDAARSLGRSLRIFKTEIKGMTEDDKARAKAQEASEQAATEPRALPAAEVVKNPDATPSASATPDASPRARPRPAPSPGGRAEAGAKTD